MNKIIFYTLYILYTIAMVIFYKNYEKIINSNFFLKLTIAIGFAILTMCVLNDILNDIF
jgi:hypothetical protein